MKIAIVIVLFLVSPALSISMGCFQNGTFSNSSQGTWLFNVTDCNICACRTSERQAVAFNCYTTSNSRRNCLIFQNYSTTSNGVQLSSSQNGSFGCFFQYPPQAVQMTSESLDLTFMMLRFLLFIDF